VAAVGRTSETYIEHHINRLFPGDTFVCSLSHNENAAWCARGETMTLSSTNLHGIQLLRRFLGGVSPRAVQRLDLVRLGLWFSRHNLSTVLCEYLQVAILAVTICRSLGMRVVGHAHGYDVTAQPLENGWPEAYLRYLPLLDDVVVVSESMKKRVLEFGVAEDRVHVIPCGAEVGIVSSRPLPERSAGSPRLIAVGRLVEKKGPIYLLESFRQLYDSLGGRVSLDVVGAGPLRGAMEQFLAATGLQHSVRLLGELPNDEVRRRLRSADVFLQHSISAGNGDEEGLPVAVLEAMAEGLPVIATRHAGIPEAVIDGQTGFLVQPGDCPAMARRTKDLLTNRTLRVGMGAAAQERVRNHFSLEAQLAQLRSVLLGKTLAGGNVS
jgi:colanic acid/amylovoran biosynthesis glycosyltransferase